VFDADGSAPLLRGLSLAIVLGLGLALELWRPHARLRPAWTANLGVFAAGTLVTSLVCGGCGFFVAEWASVHGIGVLTWAGAPGWLAAGLGVIALDAVSYLWHRANHTLPLLWRFHRVHHADVAFHVTTALRFHPGELLFALPVRLAAITLLGVPAAGVLLFELIFGTANLLEHGNFDLPGRLDARVQRVLITPSLHRAHHVAEWRLLDTNFGTVFSLWDRLGRSFRSSSPADSIVTGLPGGDPGTARSLPESLWLPFRAGRARPATEPR
jgi:sterol desaturase/sphingolipid hydroxylase (fatty acid hydroxylase superfamily)